MKGAGDDCSYELVFPERDAFPGLDAVALSVARHSRGSTSRRPDDIVPPVLNRLRIGGCSARADARRTTRYISLSGGFWGNNLCRIRFHRGNAADGDE
jgi:hypothetical protein